jgi:hypothetical protein
VAADANTRLRFVGAGRLTGFDLDLRAVTTASDAEETRRRAVRSTLAAGFLTYISKAGLPHRLDIEIGEAEAGAPAPGSDRWNLWVYSLEASVDLQAEESSRQTEWNLSASADRVTDTWKLTFGASAERRVEKFDLDEDEPLTSRRHSRAIDWLAVRGLGEHWSIGTLGELTSSSFENRKLQIGAAPAIEFNVFPYSQYIRRQLRTTYYMGPVYTRYYETTLFDKLSETRLQHGVTTTFDQRERWGTLQAQFELEQFVGDFGKYKVEFNGDVSLRIVRGLSLSIEGSASRIRNQIALPKRGATSEEVLLRLRRLQSGYEYSIDIGVTYTFGSIFNNIVNPRFGQ